MAEIGLIASIIGVAGAGFKLSVLLFDFASTIGSAGREIQDVGTEISMLCSVLNQLEVVLQHAHFHYTAEAESTTTKILRECRRIFDELDGVLTKLQSNGAPSMGTIASVDFVGRVKWTFKKSKVQLLRSTLNSCKMTLSLMLNTMQLAEKQSVRRRGAGLTLSDSSSRNDSFTLQSLIISQQCSLEQLRLLEDEAAQDEQDDTATPPTSPRPAARRPLLGHARLSSKMKGLSVNTSEVRTLSRSPTRAERASIWLSSLVFPDADKEPHPGIAVRRRMSSIDTAEAPSRLLRAWTDQGDDQSLLVQQSTSQETSIVSDVWQHSNFSFASADAPKAVNDTDPKVVINRVATDRLSPKDDRKNSITTGQHDVPTGTATLAAGLPAAISLAETDMSSTASAIARILWSFRADLSPDEVNLRIVYGGSEKMLGEFEEPADMLSQYHTLGLTPRLLLCKALAQ